MISTRKYKQFVEPLIAQIDEFFLPDYPKTIFLFTDEYQRLLRSRNEIRQIIIPSYGFPYASLYRFKTFYNNWQSLEECNHLFYLDVDMAVVSNIGDEILGDGLTITRHPGFFINNGWGSPNVSPQSLAFVPIAERKKYFAGGFSGGKAVVYLSMAKKLAHNIEDDEKRGVMAEYHDESHLNAYVVEHPEIPLIELTPSYCMVEQPHLQKAWGIDNLDKKIIALAKNHKELRS